MADWKLTADHDLDLSGGDVTVIKGQEAKAQHLRVALGFYQGEYAFDLRKGFPWLQRVLVNGFNEPDVLGLVRSYVVGLPGFESVLKLESDFDSETSTLKLSGRVQTSDGPVDFTREVQVAA